jgi:hypothetical protein
MGMPGTADGQAIMEAGLGAARATTTAAPAKGVGKSLSGLAGSVEKALKAQSPGSVVQPSAAATSPAVQTPFAAASPSPAPEPIWEDAGAIETGVTYEELIRRFGPYSMAISDSTQKMLTYRGKTGIFQVTLQDGKVAAIEKPPAPRESR